MLKINLFNHFLVRIYHTEMESIKITQVCKIKICQNKGGEPYRSTTRTRNNHDT